MKDDNDRFRTGTLPSDPFEGAVRIGKANITPTQEYRPFPVEALPEPVRSFVTEGARAIGCDPAYIALSLLAGLAAAIGNTRRIKLKEGWYEPSVLWTAIVGESGTLKSPALEVALAFLRRLQAKAIDEYRSKKKAYDEDLERYLQARRSRRRGLEEELGRPDPPKPWRILCSDITVEALAGLLEDSPRGLLLARDELSGWINSFDQYKRTEGADAAHYLSMHRAGDLMIDRKTNREIIQIPRAAVSITGGIQPRVLKRALGEKHVDNGLAARLLLAMPPRLPKRWTDAEISTSINASLSNLYSGLLALDFRIDAQGDKVPIDLPLSTTGKNAWTDFYDRHGIEQSRREGNLAAAFSKLEGYCARFALVIHLIRCQNGDPTLKTKDAVDSASIEAGVGLTSWFAYETERVYDALAISTAAVSSSSLEEIIRDNGGRISVRELQQSSRRYRPSSESARDALQQLVSSGRGRWVPASAGQKGRPSEVFELAPNPGNSGNGNETLSFGDRVPPQPDEMEAGYNRQPNQAGGPQTRNTIPSCVTGEENLTS